MSSASPSATHRKPTRRPGRKAPTLRPETNTSVTAGGRVVIQVISMKLLSFTVIPCSHKTRNDSVRGKEV